jgi:prepilin-type N-terminal cleavage/methylation domain-containing protein
VTSVLTRLRSEEGVTLIELLIAMVVTAIGTAAIVAGFSSGILAVNRANVASTAGALADKQMESYRQSSVTLPPIGVPATSTPPGPDGHSYWMQTDVISCSSATGPSTSCSDVPASRPVKLVTITVRDGSATAKVLFTENTTFDASTG